MNSYSSYEEIVKKEFPLLIQTLERHLDFNLWGFKIVHSGMLSQNPPYIIYQSEQCLIRFSWRQDRPYVEPAIYCTYGRLHAPFDEDAMVWNRRKYYCWHALNGILNFLDGLSPTEISISGYVAPRALRGFYESNKGNIGSLGEYTAKLQASIWNHYGKQFFDLLDLRRPDLWERYSIFLKKYHEHSDEQAKLEGHRPFIPEPPLYMVC
jgi:hypothetical protein